MYYRPVTLVLATYGVDNELHHTVISGPDLAAPCPSEEGLYILCRDRGLQLAAAECEQRRCSIRQTCFCTVPQICLKEDFCRVDTDDDKAQTNKIQPTGKQANVSCMATYRRTKGTDRGRHWWWDRYHAPASLHLYEAVEHARLRRLCLLAHPRTLTLCKILGCAAFCFDDELEELDVSTRTFRYAPLLQQQQQPQQHMLGYMASLLSRVAYFAKAYRNRAKDMDRSKDEETKCPPDLLNAIRDAWVRFLGYGGHELTGGVLSDDAFCSIGDEDDDIPIIDKDEKDKRDDGTEDELPSLLEWEIIQPCTPKIPIPVPAPIRDAYSSTAVASPYQTPPPSPVHPSAATGSVRRPICTANTSHTQPETSRKRRREELNSDSDSGSDLNADSDSDSDSGDYDLFDDIIAQEFPRVAKLGMIKAASGRNDINPRLVTTVITTWERAGAGAGTRAGVNKGQRSRNTHDTKMTARKRKK
ncbi:hypothetical protein F5Y17DRAFT_124613 [Xylariaceae sp. FL0594]|nr:hypothetical protein F5Y17DRAFT_124613 [Xylariaceae sp. FL0594]